MKTYRSALYVFFFLICCAVGSAAIGVESKSTVISGDSSKSGVEAFQLTLKVPLMSPAFYDVPVALVNDDPITMRDLANALATAHEERDDETVQKGKMDYAKILERLINVRMVIHEASHIGLDELPDYKSAVNEFSYQAKAAILGQEITKDVTADPEAVEKRYKEMVVEWKIRSLFFEKEDDAKSMADLMKTGKSFEELADVAIADKKATGDGAENFVKPKDLLPLIASTVSAMEIGSVSPVLKVQSGKKNGFTLLKLEDKRYPEDATAREQAEKAVLYEKKSEAGAEFKKTLHKKYVTVHEKLLGKIDYDSADPKKLEQFLKDNRVIAEIKGETPVTVSELTEALQKKHYHGLVQAAKSKKLNKDKKILLYPLIDRRAIEREATEREIAKTEEFQNRVKEFKNSKLFAIFMEKVVLPDVRPTEKDMEAYFEAHKQDYQYPEMIKMSSFAFSSRQHAESALKKLAKGADENWVKNTAEGYVADTDEHNSLSLNGSVLSTKTLPDVMRTAIGGAKSGDFRLYEASGNRFYILSIHDIIPVKQQPYEEVRELILEKVFGQKFEKTIEDWFLKLRTGSTVKIYI